MLTKSVSGVIKPLANVHFVEMIRIEVIPVPKKWAWFVGR